MINNVKIRILAFIMAVTLSFCVVSSEYQEVKALEWAGTVVAFDTAIKAILGLLGVGVAVGTASQIDWGQLKDDCVDYQISQGNNSVVVGKWWNDVIHGALDTGSSCWSAFKEWVKSLTDSGNTDTPLYTVSSVILKFYPSADLSGLTDEMKNFNYTYIIRNGTGFYFLPSSYTYNWTTNTDLSFTNGNTNLYIFLNSSNVAVGTLRTQTTVNFGFYNNSNIGFYNIEYPSLYKYYTLDLGASDIPSDTDLESAVSDLGVIGLAPDVATDLPYDGVIDIPWENIGATDTAIDDAFDDALDKVNTGTWTLDQYWTWVQNITNVFAYDTTNNFLLPNDGDDEKADDKVQKNINRGAMVLYGLDKVFPFCIPWDIYAFVNLLVADPVAPVIEYPIYNPVSGEDEIITIDFSVWESQVILMRYIQDFLLIIGLLLLARSLIGAGGSD